jgi:geranylgeranyl pyrophosphate synthase
MSRQIDTRCQRILAKFGQEAVADVNNPRLLSILAHVTGYWKDEFRPALTSFSCEAVGGSIGMADDAGVIFTLACAGFGIHDDIIDKSSKKHFRWTVPGIYGLEGALLAGDLLIVKAWARFQDVMRKTTPSKTADMMQVYGNLLTEVCESEFMETQCIKNVDIELEDYTKILWKSAADAEACTRIGAILGNGSKMEVRALAEFGRRFGFTHRLADDVRDTLNFEGNLPERLINERIPLPILYAARSSNTRRAEIELIVKKQSITPLDIKTLLMHCFRSEAFRYVKKIARKNSRDAEQTLRTLEPSFARKLLALMNTQSSTELEELCL